MHETDDGTVLYTGYDEETDILGDPVEVKTGLSDGSMVEILSGLPQGQTYYYRYADTIVYSFVSAAYTNS